MIGRSLRRLRRSRSRKAVKANSRVLRSEWLEPRTLLSGVGYPLFARELLLRPAAPRPRLAPDGRGQHRRDADATDRRQ